MNYGVLKQISVVPFHFAGSYPNLGKTLVEQGQ